VLRRQRLPVEHIVYSIAVTLLTVPAAARLRFLQRFWIFKDVFADLLQFRAFKFQSDWNLEIEELVAENGGNEESNPERTPSARGFRPSARARP
jgi:hypothetical protein